MGEVDVAIVNYNTCELLRDCLKSVYSDSPGQVIVVDNASTDDSPAMIKLEFPECHVIENETNCGYSRAANQAICASQSKYTLLLNSDTLIHPGTLAELSHFLEIHPQVGITGPRILSSDGRLQRSCFPFPILPDLLLDFMHVYQLFRLVPLIREISPRTWSHSHDRAMPWVIGAALAIRREAFDSVNGFDESFYMYYEETDLCYRMWQKGWQVHFTPAAEIIHLGGASTQQLQTKMAVQFYASLAHFYRKHYAPAYFFGMIALIRSVAMARWLRDQAAIRITSGSQRRATLARNVAAWKILMFSRWERQVND